MERKLESYLEKCGFDSVESVEKILCEKREELSVQIRQNNRLAMLKNNQDICNLNIIMEEIKSKVLFYKKFYV